MAVFVGRKNFFCADESDQHALIPCVRVEDCVDFNFKTSIDPSEKMLRFLQV
jgi:hypothetical protein